MQSPSQRGSRNTVSLPGRPPWEVRLSAAPWRGDCGRTWRFSVGFHLHAPPQAGRPRPQDSHAFLGDDRPEIAGRCIGEWRVRKHSPPSERGGPPGGRRLQECTFGVGGKGGGGEYCGWPSRHASAWSIRKGLDLSVVGIELRLVATASRSTPPVAAPSACRLPVMDIPSMAAPPPSRRGECPVAFLVPCIREIPEVVPL